MSTTMLLEVEDIQVYYGKSHILKGVSLQIGQGEIVALLGRNGAGKTTTLRSVMGHAGLKGGTIRFDGASVDRLPPHRRSRLGLGYVPQGKLLFVKMTVEENLKAAARGRCSPDEWNMIFRLFPDLEERRKQKAGTMSGGQQQMLTIARALLTRPKLLLMDEPSTGLMPVMISRMAEVIRRLHQNGMGILIVEEQIPLAIELASRLYILDVGRVVFSGRTESVNRDDLIRQYMGVSGA
jgi:branched-chain amino acid transport system ATP-binding protein